MIGKILGFLFGGNSGNSLAGKALDLASENIEDKDKLNELYVQAMEQNNKLEIARLQASTIPWVDALHKMMRPIMWLSVIAFYIYAKIQDIEVSIEELALLCSGPGVYTLMKGRGR